VEQRAQDDDEHDQVDDREDGKAKGTENVHGQPPIAVRPS